MWVEIKSAIPTMAFIKSEGLLLFPMCGSTSNEGEIRLINYLEAVKVVCLYLRLSHFPVLRPIETVSSDSERGHGVL